MKHWIIEHAGGAISYAKTNGSDPATEGVDLGLRHADTGREGAPEEAWDWTKGAWKPRLDVLEVSLLARIDRERVQQGSAILTAGAPVLLGYARKGAEVADYRTLSSDALKALDDAARRSRFPWLMAEADASSSTLADVADRIGAAIATSEFQLRSIEAKAVAAKAAVRMAKTADAKRAAAIVDWG